MSEDGYRVLEQQREDVQEWSRELSATVSSSLETSPEDATGAFDGVDQSGLSDKYESYHYDVQASFHTTQPDPLAVLAEELADYQPTIRANGSLHVSHGDLSAVFRVPPAAQDTVAFTAQGATVKIDQAEMEKWDGYVIGESVDLG